MWIVAYALRRPISVVAMAAWLHELAKNLNWKRYRKNPRKPKKPPQVQRTSRGAHRSTARILKENGHG